jgi:signal peptidase I
MAVSFLLLDIVALKTRILFSFASMVAGIVGAITWRLFVVGDALYFACKENKSEPQFQRKRLVYSVFAGMIILAPFLPALKNHMRWNQYFKAFRLSSDSMCPTACVGERLVADYGAFEKEPPHRGDAVVFDYKSTGQIFVKRVVGIGGDEVAPGPRNEILVNGKPLTPSAICGKPPLQSPSETTPPDFCSIKVPEGSFFVTGDNLDHSFDSRFLEFGLVARNQLRGKPLFLYWSHGESRIGCPIR